MPTKQLKILQMNANGSRAVMDETLAAARHKGCGCLVISEPNFQLLGNLVHHLDVTNGATIVDLNGDLGAATISRGKGYVAALRSDILLISVYVSPNLAIAEFVKDVDDVCAVVRNSLGAKVIICSLRWFQLWEICDDVVLSDHKAIFVSLDSDAQIETELEKRPGVSPKDLELFGGFSSDSLEG